MIFQSFFIFIYCFLIFFLFFSLAYFAPYLSSFVLSFIFRGWALSKETHKVNKYYPIVNKIHWGSKQNWKPENFTEGKCHTKADIILSVRIRKMEEGRKKSTFVKLWLWTGRNGSSTIPHKTADMGWEVTHRENRVWQRREKWKERSEGSVEVCTQPYKSHPTERQWWETGRELVDNHLLARGGRKMFLTKQSAGPVYGVDLMFLPVYTSRGGELCMFMYFLPWRSGRAATEAVSGWWMTSQDWQLRCSYVCGWVVAEAEGRFPCLFISVAGGGWWRTWVNTCR